MKKNTLGNKGTRRTGPLLRLCEHALHAAPLQGPFLVRECLAEDWVVLFVLPHMLLGQTFQAAPVEWVQLTPSRFRANNETVSPRTSSTGSFEALSEGNEYSKPGSAGGLN